MKTVFRTMPLLCVISVSSLGLAQMPPPPPPTYGQVQPPPAAPSGAGVATEAMQISQARQRNLALMRQYTWNTRVEMLKNNNMVDQVISQESYLPTGQLQKVVINNEHAPLPGGFIRHAVAESKLEDAKKYMAGLKELLDQYTLPSAGAILNFLMAATTTGPDAAGSLIINGNNVVVQGDTLTFWVNAKTKAMRRIQVNTNYQGSAVALTATFSTMPNGLTYMDYAEINVPAKQSYVLVQNYNYYQSAY